MSWLMSHLLIVFGFLLSIPAAAHMLSRRRTPQSSWAWLVLMFAFPWIGVPIYLLFGCRKVKGQTPDKESMLLINGSKAPVPALTRIDSVLRALGVPAAQSKNAIKLHNDAKAAYASLLDIIASAQRSIWYETFIFTPDSVGKEVLDLLCKQAAAGVEVKLLLDGVGSLHTHRQFFKPLLDAGAKFAWFMPVIRRPFGGPSLNLRNHRKIVIADGTSVWSGGRNTAEPYLSQSSSWIDLSYSLSGPCCDNFVCVFRSDWLFATGRRLEDCQPAIQKNEGMGEDVAQVIASGPDIPNDALLSGLLTAIFAAERRIWMVSPYFIPPESITDALRLAARRGVDVRIIIPAKSNHTLADWARGPHLGAIVAAGGAVLNYPSMVHAKAMVFDDDVAVFGSANMDERSLLLNYEIMIAAYSPSTIKQTSAWLEQLINQCQPWQPSESQTRRMLESLADIVAPLL